MNDQIEISNDQPKEAILANVGVEDAQRANAVHRNIERKFAGKNRPAEREIERIFSIATQRAAALKEMIGKMEDRKRELPKGSVILEQIEAEIAELEEARRNTHILAVFVSCKMSVVYRNLIKETHDKLIYALKNADKASTESIESLSKREMVLIGKEIIRNGNLIEIAEAIADGLGNTKDPSKRKSILELGKALFKALPGNEDGDLAKTYHAIFNLIVRPTKSKDCIYNVFLRKRLGLIEDPIHPDSNLKRIFDDVTVQRMKKALGIKPEPEVVFEADPLPILHIERRELHLRKKEPKQRITFMQRARALIPFVQKKGNRLAFAGRR
jgi:hypothetical protein